MNKSQKIDEQLGIMIAKEFQPFSVVENIEFRKFVHLLNPNYSIPSRKAVSKSILPQLLEKTKQKVKTNLNNAKYIAFTTDGWTSLNNDSFVAITVHYIDNIECVLKSYLLGCYYFEQAHTAINLSEFMIKCFDEWEISEKIKVAVSNNAANITSAISLNSNWRHMPCLAHGINLIAQSGLSEIQSVHKKVKSIVEFFKRSTKSYIKLKQTQTQMGQPLLKLIQDVATRWNSTCDMFQRCIDIKDPLISTIALIGKNENLTPDDFYIMEHYCSVFKPFKEMTIELSSEKGVSISKVIILCNVLLSHIKKKKNEPNLPSAIYSMLLTMETKAEKRFERIEEQRLLTEATILDPRFKKRGFSNTKSYEFAYQKIIQRVTTIIQSESEKHNLSGNEVNAVQENVNEKEKFDIWKDFDLQVWFLLYIILVSTYSFICFEIIIGFLQVPAITTISTPKSKAIIEIDKYLNEPLLDRKSDPLMWWKQMKTVYPNLFQLALLRLCVPSTSVPCERIFSKAGYTISDRRNRLSIKNAESLFLNSNI